jgi:hypothetical protein
VFVFRDINALKPALFQDPQGDYHYWSLDSGTA